MNDSEPKVVITNNTLFKNILTIKSNSELSGYEVKTAENVYNSTNRRVVFGTDNGKEYYKNYVINNYPPINNFSFNLNSIDYNDEGNINTLPLTASVCGNLKYNENNEITWEVLQPLEETTRNEKDWYLNDYNLEISSLSGSYFTKNHTYINLFLTDEQFEIRGKNYWFTNIPEISSTEDYKTNPNVDKYGKVYKFNDQFIFEPSNNNLNVFKGCIRYNTTYKWEAINFDAYNNPNPILVS